LGVVMLRVAPGGAASGVGGGGVVAVEAGGVLYLYGPYKVGGRHPAPSIESFEGWLKERDRAFGVRDLAAVQAEAEKNGLSFIETRAMPANNFSVIFKKAASLLAPAAPRIRAGQRINYDSAACQL